VSRARARALRFAAAAALLAGPMLAGAQPALRLERTLEAARPPMPMPMPIPTAAEETPLALRPSAALPERAPPTPAPPAPAPTQPLIVSLVVNQVGRGERFARLTADGRVLLRHEDLREIAAVPEATPRSRIEGEDYVDARAISTAASFDERTLTLDLRLPAASFPRQVFDLGSRRAPAELTDPPASALVAYRLGYWGTDRDTGGTLTLTADANLAWRHWLLRNRSLHAHTRDGTDTSRLETQLVRDDLANLRRLTLGDFVTPALALGASVPLAGISLAKAYLLSPYLVRYPTVGYQGLAESPSQVDFYVGNTLISRQQVGPGPFDIRNFSFFGGRRDVRVVIRDALGRERTLSYPFYFATEGLAAGLHDYAYQAGWLREAPAATRGAYGEAAYSAFHQYGLDGSWTLGARLEGTARLASGGGDVFYRSESLGSFALHASASRDRDAGTNGSAASLSHAFQRGDFSSFLVWQRYSRGYTVLHPGSSPVVLPEQDASASLGYTTALGSFGLALTRLVLRGEAPRRTANLSWSLPLSRSLAFNSYVRREWSEQGDTQVFVGLQYTPSARQNATLSHLHESSGSRTTSAQWSTQIPQGEGTAYALSLQRQQGAGGSTSLVAPRLLWNGRHATVAAEASHIAGGGQEGTTALSVTLDGALVATGGQATLTRAVADSFAIVQTDPPMEGIRVYENSQEVGRTDAAGRILLTHIAAYATNQTTIEHKDVPIDYAIDKLHQSFAVPARSGRIVPFAITRVRGYTGAFVRRVAGARVVLEHQLVVVRAGGRSYELPTGRGGEFYGENLPPGRHPAVVRIDGSACEFFLDVPDSPDTMVSLGDVMTCDAR